MLIPYDGKDQPTAAIWIAGSRNRSPLIMTATSERQRRPITMLWIIALALIAIVALTVLGFTLHLLFSPWLLVAVGILAWIKFRPRRSHR